MEKSSISEIKKSNLHLHHGMQITISGRRLLWNIISGQQEASGILPAFFLCQSFPSMEAL